MLFDSIVIFLSQLLIFIEAKDLQNNNQTFHQCPNELFSCDQHRCIPYAFICNGEYNCQDKTDEINCSTTLINQNFCPENLSVKCQQDILHSTRSIDHDIHYEYIHPIEICIHRSSACDGIVDCRNGLDEQCEQSNPLMICSTNEYHCQITNRCIPNTWKCNGINDCLDLFASDELDCPKRICQTNEFACRTRNQCIQSTAICDGFQDCADNSDESIELCSTLKNCTDDEFRCKSTNLCIRKAFQCDTISQCHDRTDELDCQCPIEDYLSEKLFYRCTLTNQCLPKNLECNQKHQCHSEDFEDDDDQCPSIDILTYRKCSENDTCSGEYQFCQIYPNRQCVCQHGYRMNETSGICEDINECRERVICDHYCRNTHGSYQCSCQENYLLDSDKHTCILRLNTSQKLFYGLFDDGIYRIDIDQNNEFILNTKRLIFQSRYIYLIDHDPIDNYLYFTECASPLRSVLMSCTNTSGIFRLDLTQYPYRKQLIIDGRDYTSIQSFAIDWLHRNIYFINTRSQTINVCRLNGSFCYVLFHQTLTDYLPQRIVLYPEKGLLFYTSVVKSRAQHIIRLGMDGQNLKLLFTIKITNDHENVRYLRPLLTFDQINHLLYFYNGFDQIYILNLHGEILHIQYQIKSSFHSLRIHADKIYKSFVNEFHIQSKYSLGTIQFDPIVEIYPNKNSLSFNSFHQSYSRQYAIDLLDFIFVILQNQQRIGQEYPCEQLALPNVNNQTEIVCACAQFYKLDENGYSCSPNCPMHFFNCEYSKKCIPFYRQCDGRIDCQYGEDENHCLNDSKCWKNEDLCNNQTDCLSGEDEDELICQQYCQASSSNTCSKKYSKLCSETEFYCDGKCVSITHRCDEQPYCYDGADEPVNCVNITCPINYFKCPNSGKCIPNENVCDNFDDCLLIDKINGTSADETPQSCNYILTQSTSATTVPSITCESVDLFRCKTSQFCINRTYVCDGDLDCSDSSDEENCDDSTKKSIFSLSFHHDHTCINGYRCAQQRHELNSIHSLCIPLNELCDGIYQCPLGDDEHHGRCRNCTNCDTKSSFCEIINRIPTCQCRHGYTKIVNGSCILDDELCNWSYDHCSHVKFSNKDLTNEFCLRKSSYINCQCDYGYETIENKSKQTISCQVQTNRTLDLMLNPRASFYFYSNQTLFAPINPSHHAIDVIFIPYKNSWLMFYTEQRNGHGFIWQQNVSHSDALQIWSSMSFQFTSIRIDWIHRLIYVLYDDPSSLSNGIEILHANQTDYKHLVFVNRLTFSNRKTISSIQVHPLQGYLYISAYYDAQHSFIYRSLLDGTNLEIFLTLEHPVLCMTIDYRHPRLYVLLSNGFIESYSIDRSQPWKANVYKFQNIDYRPYFIDLLDDQLNVMIFDSNASIYNEVLIDKFGRTIENKQRHFQTPMIIRHVHEHKYPQIGKSEMINQVCSDPLCPHNRICISTPANRPLCIQPGQINLCGSSCLSRGICSNGRCICSNRTYTGSGCEICRWNENINVGCFHLRHDPYMPCMCYLTKSRTKQTPYLCTTLKSEHGEIEIPCDRFVSPVKENACQRRIFAEPYCHEKFTSLIYHRQTQTCICREAVNRKTDCLNSGMLIVDDHRNATTCLCSFPYYGNHCELNPCTNYCRNNGSCLVNGKSLFCSCLDGFTGERCENNLCQSIKCPTNQTCFIQDQKPICRCPRDQMCEDQKHFPWRSWFLTIFICLVCSTIAYFSLQYSMKYVRLKYLFSHHRLHEQIHLETNSTNASYSHLSVNDERDNLNTDMNQIEEEEEEEDVDDPFYIDEKQPIFTRIV